MENGQKKYMIRLLEQGYQALEVPEKYGGPGLRRVDIAALIEEMAIADAGLQLLFLLVVLQ